MKSKRKHNRQSDHIKLLGWIVLLSVLAAGGYALLQGHEDSSQTDVATVINEVMSANKSAYPDTQGRYLDWIELKNTGDGPVSLKGLRLACPDDLRAAYTFPDETLEVGECIVVYCDEDAARTDGSIAPFSISKDGATLCLIHGEQEVVDRVEVPALGRGQVYARQDDGTWIVSDEYTPGLDNTTAAYRQITSVQADSGLYINEVMAANESTLADADGEYPDWIELYNGSNEAVSLLGWSLTNTLNCRDSWSFPDITMDAGEYLLIYASGKSSAAGDELHASFKISRASDTVFLVDPLGSVASEMQISELGKDVSLSRLEDGSTTDALTPSPGRENSDSGAESALGDAWSLAQTNTLGLYINEAVCSMTDSCDWMELYNASGADIDISGWWLSDDAAHPRKWAFPDATTIAAGEYKLVMLSGDEAELSEDQKQYLCADFSLALDGSETLTLADPTGNIIDSMQLRRQCSNVSYGRADGSDRYRYFTDMTPGTANAAVSYAGCASAVSFSQPGGIVDGDCVTLALSSDEGAVIYYTLDGTAPTASSSVYSEPLQLRQTTVVRAIATGNDMLPSLSSAATFIFGDSTTLRVVCVTGEAATLTGSDGVLNTGRKDRQQVYIEVYDYDGTKMLGQNCELVMAGKSSRAKAKYPQKAFRLSAKSALGDSKFRAKLFTNRDFDQYDSFVMRASGQDVFKTHMRDSILTSLAADLNLAYQETELAAVYVNGQYWGMYNMRERMNDDWLCAYHGWDSKSGMEILENKTLEVVRGNRDNYLEMMNYVDSADFTTNEAVEGLRRYCDIENYLNYVAIQIYSANEDLGNVRVYRNTGDVWRWELFDMDFSFSNDKNSAAMWLKDTGTEGVGSVTQQDNRIFVKLMQNADMRNYFLTHFGQLLATTFSSENVTARITTRRNAIAAEMKKSCARWGVSTDSWNKACDDMLAYAETRTTKIIGYTAEAFALTEAQTQQYFGEALQNEANE